jgi:hypothetical protein
MGALRHVLAAVLLLSAAPAYAQRVDGRGVPYRAWDFDIGSGIYGVDRIDGAVITQEDEWYHDWNVSWSGGLHVGRYWSGRLKTEAGINLTQAYYSFGRELVTLPDGQTGYAYVDNRVRQTQVTVSTAYQFLDNTFAHPYVAAGARVGLLQIDGSRYPQVYVNRDGSYRSYVIEEQRRYDFAARVRPFIAVGSKSYFSERTFLRPEFVMAFNHTGISQMGLQLGFGVDF